VSKNATLARRRSEGATGSRSPAGLTQRQEAFCLAFVEAGNASEAYRRSYRPKRMSAKSVHEKASHILAAGKVRARVAELRGKAAEKAVLTLEAHLEKLAELRDLAVADDQLDAAIRAETKRGEAAGLYPDRGKAVNVSLLVPAKSEPVSETTRWVNELTGRDVTQQ
jgi:phage terminase small subunit